MTDKHTLKVQLADDLGHAIGNLGYEVGMGVRPNPKTMEVAAEKIMSMIAAKIGIPTSAIESGAVAELIGAAQEYMAQIGQGYLAHDLPFGPAQESADKRIRAALANIGAKP